MSKLEDRRKKEGLIWVNQRTGQLRYSHSNKKPVDYLQPLEVYKAGEPIKRGESVSVAIESDANTIADNLGVDYDPSETYIVKTNTAKHKKSLGLALEPGNIGKEVHIQSFGSFEYKITDEYVPNFNVADIGKTIYVKGSDSEPPEYGHLTVDTEESWKNYKNIITLGTITDVPLGGTTQDTIRVSLRLEGDQRGLLDSTQFELKAGESFTVPLQSPIKVICIGSEDQHDFEGYISYDQSSQGESLTEGYIGFSRSDGKTVFLRFGSIDVPSVDAQIDITNKDATFVRTALYHAGGNSENIRVININQAEYSPGESVAFRSLLQNKITEALTFLSGSATDITITPNISGNWCTLNFSLANPDCFYDMHISRGLSLFKSGVENAGSSENKGKGVLADIRYAARQDVVGLYYSNKYDTPININDHILVIKNGVFKIPENSNFTFNIGKVYYLGFNGDLVEELALPTYLDSVVKIGKATSSKELILFVEDSRQYAKGSLPIGYIKPSVNNVAEYGFRLADGLTELDADENAELLAALRKYFTDEELSVTTL